MSRTENAENSTPPRGPWQFSMKTLLVVTAATAVALAIVVSLPNAIAVPVMLCLAIGIPAFLTVIVIYGSGYQRTFCIGALFPACAMLHATGWLLFFSIIEGPGNLEDLGRWLEFFDEISAPYRVYTGAAWLLAIVVGFVAVGVRWQLEARAQREKKEK